MNKALDIISAVYELENIWGQRNSFTDYKKFQRGERENLTPIVSLTQT